MFLHLLGFRGHVFPHRFPNYGMFSIKISKVKTTLITNHEFMYFPSYVCDQIGANKIIRKQY